MPNNSTSLVLLYIGFVILLIILAPIALIALYVIGLHFLYKSYRDTVKSNQELKEQLNNATENNPTRLIQS